MKPSHRLSSFPYVPLIALLLLGTVNTLEICAYGPNTCCIQRYIDSLYQAWTATSLPSEISSGCQNKIFLKWAYELRGALEGKTTMTRHGHFNVGMQELKARCKRYARRRTNRNTSNHLTDVFKLLLKLSTVLQRKVDLCSLIIYNYNKHYFEQTGALVTKMNRLVRQQNKLRRGQLIHRESFSLQSLITIAMPLNIPWVRNWPIGYGR